MPVMMRIRIIFLDMDYICEILANGFCLFFNSTSLFLAHKLAVPPGGTELLGPAYFL